MARSKSREPRVRGNGVAAVLPPDATFSFRPVVRERGSVFESRRRPSRPGRDILDRSMNRTALTLSVLLGSSFLPARTGSAAARTPPAMEEDKGYLPGPAASRVVSISESGPARAAVVVQTQAVAVKETGPKETVRTFGEVSAFSPSFFAVHRDEPTQITFWNLQPDDLHDFLLTDPDDNVLAKILLPPLKKTTYVMTFHREGLFPFYCAAHPPAMAGQILVLPPRRNPASAPPPDAKRKP